MHPKKSHQDSGAPALMARFKAFVVPSIVIGMLALMLTVLTPQPVKAAGCNPFPKVDWWVASHAAVVKIVDKRYKGNWVTYIDRWNTYRNRMQETWEGGSFAIVKSRDLRLEGEALAKHIEHIDQRIEILECLNAKAKEDDIESMANFSTAAGGPSDDSRPVSKIVRLLDSPFSTEITAICENTKVVFELTNLSEKWPRHGTISIYRTGNRAKINQRRIRLASSQQARFQIHANSGHNSGELGLHLAPSWIERPFVYDAKINCSQN